MLVLCWEDSPTTLHLNIFPRAEPTFSPQSLRKFARQTIPIELVRGEVNATKVSGEQALCVHYLLDGAKRNIVLYMVSRILCGKPPFVGALFLALKALQLWVPQ